MSTDSGTVPFQVVLILMNSCIELDAIKPLDIQTGPLLTPDWSIKTTVFDSNLANFCVTGSRY